VVPEALKPRRIAIGNGAPSAAPTIANDAGVVESTPVTAEAKAA
jgi:hypothetical protein